VCLTVLALADRLGAYGFAAFVCLTLLNAVVWGTLVFVPVNWVAGRRRSDGQAA